MASNCGAQPPNMEFKDRNTTKNIFKTNTSELLSTHLDTSPMTLYVIILTHHTLETRLKDSQKYADRMEEHPKILATDLMKKVNWQHAN